MKEEVSGFLRGIVGERGTSASEKFFQGCLDVQKTYMKNITNILAIFKKRGETG